MRPKSVALLIPAFALAAFALFANHVPASLAEPGQQIPTSRKPACGCYVCGKLIAVEFPDKEKDCAGILAADACGKQLENMPNEKRAAFCQKIRAGLKFNSFKDSCPDYAQYCESEDTEDKKDEKCDKPNPWFGPPSNCKEVQSPVIAINEGAVTLSMCGYPIFRWVPTDKDPLLVDAYKSALREWVQARVGSKICCDKLRDAARTGNPCYPGADVDCDGKPNQSDVVDSYPDIDAQFSKPEGAPIDPFPAGLDPDDTEFFPPQEKCDCKWELVKGTLHCSPDGKQRHFYEARWRCPSTGNERYTRKEAPATAPCP